LLFIYGKVTIRFWKNRSRINPQYHRTAANLMAKQAQDRYKLYKKPPENRAKAPAKRKTAFGEPLLIAGVQLVD
jgi:hypothetical protein